MIVLNLFMFSVLESRQTDNRFSIRQQQTIPESILSSLNSNIFKFLYISRYLHFEIKIYLLFQIAKCPALAASHDTNI
jgi:hypothetical protein